MKTRTGLLRLHRWAGMFLAGFLVVAGLTGSLLAFEEELEGWLNPQLFRVAIPHDAAGAARPFLDPFLLREKAQAHLGAQARVDSVVFNMTPGHSVLLPLSAQAPGFSADEIFLDPYTGAVLGLREEGASPFDRHTLIGFLYRLHYSLALPGVWGLLLFGIVALLWTLDSVLGLLLTLPPRSRRKQEGGRGFWSRWRPAWQIKRGASRARLQLDLHRAFSLWLWGMLLVFAWSSVMFNLREPVFRPVMGLFFRFDDSWRSLPARATPLETPALDWQAAQAAGRLALQELATRHGFVTDREERLMLDRRRGVYAYMAHSTADLRRDTGNTAVLIDADTGAIRGQWLPSKGETGNTVSNWLGALHMGHVFGLPYRVFVSFFGLVVVMLSVTGVLIWWRKAGRRVVKSDAV